MFKKIFFVALVLLFAGFFAGCERKDRATSGLLAPGETFELEIWTADYAGFFASLGSEFVSAARSPGLSTRVVKFQSDSELQSALVDAMAEGAGPDVIFTDGGWVSQNPKKITPLDSDPSFSPEKFRSSFVRSSHGLLRDGKIFAIPLGVETLAMFFNEDHLVDRLAVRNEPGATWNDFESDILQLSRPNKSFERFSASGAAIGRTDNLTHAPEILENLWLQMRVELFSKDATEAIFASTSGVSSSGKTMNFAEEALRFFTNFADPRHKNFAWSRFLADPDSEDREFETFARGKVSQVFGTPSDLDRIKKIVKNLQSAGDRAVSEKNIRVAFFPQVDDPNSSASRRLVAKIRVLAVPKSTSNRIIAWKFLKFAARPDNLRAFFAESRLPGALLELIPEQEADSELQVFVRQAKFASPRNLPAGLSQSDFLAGIADTIQKINDGETSVERALKNLETKFTQKIRRHREIQDVIHPKIPEK